MPTQESTAKDRWMCKANTDTRDILCCVVIHAGGEDRKRMERRQMASRWMRVEKHTDRGDGRAGDKADSGDGRAEG